MRHVEWLGETELEERRRSAAPYLLWGGVVVGTLWIFFKTLSPVRSS